MSGLTQQRLKELLHYDAETGIFTRKVRTANRTRVGEIVGSRHSGGYVCMCIDGNKQLAHRLAWLYVHGKFPDEQLDHINGDRSDNRLANLREANNKQNQENIGLRANNSTGFRGVSFNTQSGKFEAYVQHNGRRIYAGRFEDAEQAASAAAAKRAQLFTHDTGRDRVAA